MFLSDKFIYVDLNKTGSVAIMNWLKKLDVPMVVCQHHLKPGDDLIESDRIKFATIRDPWSYYLSLWSYGCKKKKQSGAYNSLTRFSPFKHRGFSYNRWGAIKSVGVYLVRSLSQGWSKNKQSYSDPDNPDYFRAWLKKIQDAKTSVFLSGGYYSSGIHDFCGLYSYRFCNLYCKNNTQLHSGSISDYKMLETWMESNLYIDQFLNTGTLREDFIDFILTSKIVPQDADLSFVRPTRMNSSISETTILSDFYDDESIELVTQREKLIVDRFQYNFADAK